MCGKRTFKKYLSAVLSVVVAVGMMPISVMAETGNLNFSEGGEILSFEELTSEVMAQSVPLSTSQSELNLPQTLAAEVRLASAKDAGDSEQGKQESSTVSDPAAK